MLIYKLYSNLRTFIFYSRHSHPIRQIRIDLSRLRLFYSIITSSFLATFHSCRVKFSADNRITQVHVFHAPTAHQNNRVFLQSMSNSRNISGYFHSIRKAHTGDFSYCGVRFAWRFCSHFCANPSLERRIKKHRTVPENVKTFRKRRRFILTNTLFARTSYQLIYCRHRKIE